MSKTCTALSTLTIHQRAAIYYIGINAGVELGDLPLGTVRALERRGLVTSHSSSRWPGSIGHFLTDDGAEIAKQLAIVARQEEKP